MNMKLKFRIKKGRTGWMVSHDSWPIALCPTWRDAMDVVLDHLGQ